MQNYHLLNRPNRELKSEEEIAEVLKKGKYAIISMCRNNEPYIVSLSYGYDAEKKALYFHSAIKGLKLDFIRANPLVCATVIDDGGYVVDECGHNYRTVVFWGNMYSVSQLEEKKHGMQVIINHLESTPDVKQQMLLKSDSLYSKMEILRLDIAQIHGKAGR